MTDFADKVSDFKDIVRRNFTFKGVMRDLGLPLHGGSYRLVRRTVSELSVDISHFNSRKGISGWPPNKRSLTNVLVRNSTYTNSSNLKKRLLRDGLLVNKCYLCGQPPVWASVPLTLVLDHVNGVHSDNRWCNLRLLCPNCNSQQRTFCRGRYSSTGYKLPRKSACISKKSRYKVSSDVLQDALKTHPNIRQALLSVGLVATTGNYIRARSLLQKPPKFKLYEKNCVKCGTVFAITHSKQKSKKYCSIECWGKASRRCARPSKDALLSLVRKHPLLVIGKMYGVSDNAVRKWCRMYSIPKTESKYSHVPRKNSVMATNSTD